MDNSGKSINKSLLIVFGIAVLLFFLRIPVFARYLLYLAALALLGGLIYGIVYWVQGMRRKKAERIFRGTREGRLREKVEECEALLARNEAEMVEIKREIADLAAKADLPGLSAQQGRETRELQKAFQSEWDLRHTKALFFERCRDKLKQLEQHFTLERDLVRKKNSLRKLQENNFEELAQFESIKTELELNAYYLETIDDLSSRMIASTDVSDAKHLQLELEEMTKDLDEV